MLPDLLAQTTPIDVPPIEWVGLLPVLILIGAAAVLMAVAPMFGPRLKPWVLTAIPCAAVVGAGVVAVVLWNQIHDRGVRTIYADSLSVDGFSVVVTMAVCVAALGGLLLASGYLERQRLGRLEFGVLVLLATAGAVVMGQANDLIVVFLGLEVLSISLYVLVAYHRRHELGREAAMKYFLLGAFASAIFLYGIALVYGATGSTNLLEIRQFLGTRTLTSEGILLGGVALLIVGLGFKVAAAPFHFWAPDVYQGAPTPVTAYMAAAAKTAGFAALLRVLYVGLQTYVVDWRPIVWVIAILTLLVGSLLAVVQTDVKRMLAYSSIAHAGFVLVGVQAGTAKGVSSSLYYLGAYTLLALGSFGVLTLIAGPNDSATSLVDLRGLSRRRPALAVLFGVLLLAQAGVPPSTGFLAKFEVISAAVDARSYALAIVAMLAAVVATFFYLRIAVAMFMEDDGGATAKDRSTLPLGGVAVVVVAVVVTIGAGLWAQPALDIVRDAVMLGQ